MAAIPPGRSHSIALLETIQHLQEEQKQRQKRIDFFRLLGLPIVANGLDNLYSKGVYDILNDKDKLRELISKLNNKAFW